MGVTIHYAGRAKNWDALTQLLSAATQFAAQRGWMFAIYDDPLGVMEDRDHDDPGYIEHDGPFRGMVIRPHPRCEPVRLDFSTSNELSGFTKTQFAPFEVHVEVVRLLREIEPFMAEFSVNDESGLWDSRDEAAARSRFEALRGAIEALADGLRDSGVEVDGPGAEVGRPDPPYG